MFKSVLMTNNLSLLLKTKCISKTFSSICNILETKKSGDVITVKGWIKSLRNQKEHIFLDVSDGSTDKKLQICVPKNSKYNTLSTGASVIASGSLTLSAKGQIELSAQSIEICGPCVVTEGYPFAPRKQYTPEYIRQYLHFRPRTNKFSALLRLRNTASLAIHNYLNSAGFINVHTPILTSNDCEGAGEVFKVLPENEKLLKSMIKDGQSKDEAYFNTKAYLTVSGQLHLESAAHGLSKVYTFGPTFRAENSRSRLHLSEFYMLEAEIAFVNQLKEVTDCVENLVKEVTQKLIQQSFEDIERCQEIKTNFTWLDKKFPVLTYEEAVQVLKENEKKFKESFDSKDGLGKEHELFLVEHNGNIPVFVINWPKDMKPFYMKENDSGDKVFAFDLLGPNVGEIVGGSLRETDYNRLKSKIPDGIRQLDWYLDLRKFGSVPTGGFGLGFERYLQSLLGIGNIKDTIPFPRWPHNCSL